MYTTKTDDRKNKRIQRQRVPSSASYSSCPHLKNQSYPSMTDSLRMSSCVWNVKRKVIKDTCNRSGNGECGNSSICLLRCKLKLDFRNGLRRVESLRACSWTVENGVATVHAQVILKLLTTLLLVGILYNYISIRALKKISDEKNIPEILPSICMPA